MQITVHRSDVEMAEHDDNCAKIRTNGMGTCGCGADDKTEELRKSGFKTFAALEAAQDKQRLKAVVKPKRFTNKILRDKITAVNNILWTLERTWLPHTDHCPVSIDRECDCVVKRVRHLHYEMKMLLFLR